MKDYIRIHEDDNVIVALNEIKKDEDLIIHEPIRSGLSDIVSAYVKKENPDLEMTPQTFIFGAKAAPGYYMAKKIIKLICYLAEDINGYLLNYNEFPFLSDYQ